MLLFMTRGNNQSQLFPGSKPAKVIGFNFNFFNGLKLIEAAAATVCRCPPEGRVQKKKKKNSTHKINSEK